MLTFPHKALEKSNRKPNKIGEDKGSKSYKRLMISWLRNKNIEMYSTHNEEKPVVTKDLLGS